MYGDDEFLFPRLKGANSAFWGLKTTWLGLRGRRGDHYSSFYARQKPPKCQLLCQVFRPCNDDGDDWGPRINNVCNISGFCDPLGWGIEFQSNAAFLLQMLKVCLTSLGSYIWQFDSLLCLIFGYSPDRLDILCEWPPSTSRRKEPTSTNFLLNPSLHKGRQQWWWEKDRQRVWQCGKMKCAMRRNIPALRERGM